jgi:hypothetical protein
MVLRIGEKWRGDWSGHDFDGRDGQQWLLTAVTGSSEELDELQAALDEED